MVDSNVTRMSMVDEVVSLLNMLGKHRWTNTEEMDMIGLVLRRGYGEKYKSTWLQMSKISPLYDEEMLNALWSHESHESCDLEALEEMAKTDDPIGYRMHKARYISPEVLDNWDQQDRGLSIIAYKMLKNKVKKCGKSDIYLFLDKDCRWIKCVERSLRIMLSLAVEDCLRDVITYYSASSSVSGLSDAERRELDEKQAAVMQRIVYMRKTGGMNNVVTHLADMCQDDSFEQRLDSVPHLLGVKNGVIDLRTAELRLRKPCDYIYTVLDIEYDKDADDTVMTETISSAMADDAEMSSYIQKLLGYGITGEVSEEIFPIFTGKGRNCKGVITQTIQKILGSPFYVDMNAGIICERQVANIDAERGKLLGARIAVFSELQPGEKLKSNEVQLLSGGDGISATPKYKDPMTIMPRHLCILATNHMPEISPVITAIMERLICIDFPVTFTDLLPGELPTKYRRQANKGLKTYLDSHKDQVLAWLVRGAKMWYEKPNLKRDAPLKVRDASNKYFFEQDKLAQFMSESCSIGPSYIVKSSDLRDAFNSWNDDEKSVSSKEFVKLMRFKGFEKEVSKMNGVACNCFKGLGLSCSYFPIQ